LFDFARYEEPSLPADHSLDRIIDQTLAALQSCSRMHRFAIEKQTSGVQVRCRFKEVALALFYLGENALEAMPAGGTVSVATGVTTAVDGRRMATVTVQDSGPGLPEDIRLRLFAPYVSTKGPAPPAGLGLYASRLLLRRYGGTIVVEEAATGARFRVMLPCCGADEEEVMAGTAVAANPSGVNNEAGRRSIGRQVFLVVDDDEAMRDLLVTGLQKRGHVVFCAETCAEAVDAYRQVHAAVTVLLIDIGLGDGNGYACAEQLLTEGGRPALLFLSGDEAYDGRRWETAGFVKKPFTIIQLEVALHGVHSGRQG
jgi:CheY-like chemotaxis protein